jgi:hypothetical protein
LANRLTTSDIERPDLIQSVRCTDERLVVALNDGQTISVLSGGTHVSFERRRSSVQNFEIGRFGIHWPEIDEDLDSRRPAPRRQATGQGVREQTRKRHTL